MVAATRIGTKNGIWLFICLLLWLRGNGTARRAAVRTLGASLTAQAIVNLLLKRIFRRDRPFRKARNRAILLVAPPREHSWPSGHAASSAAALTVLGHYYPRQVPALALLAGLISYSRVYVGVHYPFDVAGGSLIGLGVGIVWLGLGEADDPGDQRPAGEV